MGFFKSIGKLFNDVTGATSAAELQNNYNKEFAQNSIQWQANDLEKAGFNRALAATSGMGNSGGSTAVSSGINPIDTVNSIIGMMNQTSATKSLNNLQNAQAMRVVEMLPFEKDEKLKIIQKLATGASLDIAVSDFMKRRGSGKGFNINTPYGGMGMNY